MTDVTLTEAEREAWRRLRKAVIAAPTMEAIEAVCEFTDDLAARLAPYQEAHERATALADEWQRSAGEASEAWRVYGPQTVSVPFAVQSIRAALRLDPDPQETP